MVKSAISDHFPVFVNVLCLESGNRNCNIYYSRKIINNTCRDKFASAMSLVNFEDILNSYDVNNVYNMFVQKLQQIFNSCFPEVTIKKKKLDVHKPYISNEIKTLIREKHRLQRLYHRWPITYEKQFKLLRNRVNSAVRNAKRKYYCDLLNKNSSNIKNT